MILNHHQQHTQQQQDLFGSLAQNYAKNGRSATMASVSTSSSRSSTRSQESERTLAQPARHAARYQPQPQQQQSSGLFDISDPEEDAYGSSWAYGRKASAARPGKAGNPMVATWNPRKHADNNVMMTTQQAFEHMSIGSAATSAPPAAVNKEYNLQDEIERQEYFEQVQVRFLVYCSTLSALHQEYAKRVCHSRAAKAAWPEEARRAALQPGGILSAFGGRYTYASIETSLRKLCDLMHDQPSEQFTADVFVFSIKISAMEGRHEMYVDKFQYVLHKLHHEGGIDEVVLNRVFTLYVLHLMHHDNDSIQVFDLLGKYFTISDPLWETVRAWLERDYLTWRRMFDGEQDVARRRVMQFGELTMAKEALQRMTRGGPGAGKRRRSNVSERELMLTMGANWQGVLAELGREWSRDGSGMVVFAA